MLLTEARRIIANRRLHIEKRLESRARGIFIAQARKIDIDDLSRGIREAQPEQDDLWWFIVSKWPEAETQFSVAIGQASVASARVVGNLTLANIGYSQAFTIGDPVRDRLAQSSLVAARSIDNTSKARIRTVMQRGFIDGRSTQAIARDIRAEMGEWPRWRAEMIARTEVAEAWESTRYEVLARNGVQARQWITSMDERVDGGNPSGPCIVNAEAGPVPMNSAFPSGSMFPPAHPNCRCDVVVPEGSGVPEGRAWTGGSGGLPIQMPERRIW